MSKALILIADDETLVAETLVAILLEEGYEAVSVPDGLAAVDFVSHTKPDVVICDVVMPKMNGIEAAKRIRKIAPDAHILLFSGQAATTDLLDEAHREGFRFEVLAKPLKPEVLLATIAGLRKAS